MAVRLGTMIVELLCGVTLAGVGLAFATLLASDGFFAGSLPWLAIFVCTIAIMLRPGGTLRKHRTR